MMPRDPFLSRAGASQINHLQLHIMTRSTGILSRGLHMA